MGAVERSPQGSHTGEKAGEARCPYCSTLYKFKGELPKGIINVARLSDQVIKKILVVAPSWVGDTMLIQPNAGAPQQRTPDCLIDVLAPPWTEELCGKCLKCMKRSPISFRMARLDRGPFPAWGHATRQHYGPGHRTA